MIGNYFENQLLRKYIIIFGTLFNNIHVARNSETENKVNFFKVPIEYGPRERALAMLRGKPDKKRVSIQLPRMSFEITGMQPDSQRKIARGKTITSGNKVIYKGAPWNINFQLNIITKNALDATKIVEQALWYFRPDYTIDAKLLDGLEHVDRIPVVFNDVSHEDLYEGEFTGPKRAIIWTINFTLKGWLYGPVDDSKVIKFIDIRTHMDMNPNSTYAKHTVQPGLTVDGEPTTDIDETIPYFEIDETDNWDIIEKFVQYGEDTP